MSARDSSARRRENGRTSHPNLNFVADKKCAVLPAQAERLRQIIVGGNVHSLALDRFHDECGHVSLPQLLFQGCKIVHGTASKPGISGSNPCGSGFRR